MRYIRFDSSNSKLFKNQRGHMLDFYAISIAIASTTLKFNQFGTVTRVELFRENAAIFPV